MRLRRAAAVVLATASIGLITVAPPPADAGADPAGGRSGPTIPHPGHGGRRERSNVDPALLEADHPAPASGAPAVDDAGRVVVVVEGSRGKIEHAVHSVGGEITNTASDLVEAAVPQERLQDLGSSDGVQRVREPQWFLPAWTSEGVTNTNTGVWHAAGRSGVGVEVAIVDSGFESYASKLGTELPASVELTSYCANGGDGTGDHGTAVAEIVHDMAPGASLHLICIDTDADMPAAGQTLISQGIRVANMSGGFILTGRGDGSGSDSTPAGVVRTTRMAGVLWVVAAGNFGGGHYDFVSTDRDGDGYVELDPGPVDPAALDKWTEVETFSVGGGGAAEVSLRWDAWPLTTQDYDMYVLDVTDSSAPVVAGFSENEQWPGGGSPIEQATVVNNASDSHVYAVVVERYRASGQDPFVASATSRFDLFISGDGFLAGVYGGRVTTSASITEPATSPYAMAIGARCYASAELEPYSGQGPTIDGRIKPDLVGPDGVSSSIYGGGTACWGVSGFDGTSAAAPHVAGAAALYLGANPGLDVAEVQHLLEMRASDVGAPGRDPQWGAGDLDMLNTSSDAPAGELYAGLDAPVRIIETRSSVPGGCQGHCGALGSGESLQLDAKALPEVPDDATAVVLNVTAVGTTQTGFLTVFPSGSTRPTASNVNFGPGQTLANHVTATLSPAGAFDIYNHFGTTDIVVDLIGYYADSGSVGMTAITPVRAVETRSSVPGGCFGHCGAFGSGETFALPMRGATFQGTTIPEAATAVVLNVTAVQPTANGFLTVWPGGTTRPTASSLNFAAGGVVPNLVVAGIGANGNVEIYNYFGSTDVVVDVLGYFQPGAARYVPLDPPTRTLDTRTGNGLRLGALTGFEELPLQVGRIHGVPLDAVGALFNVTVAAPVSPGFLTVWPAGAPRPNSSNVNFGAGAVVSNAVLTALPTGGVPYAGVIQIYNHGSSQSTHALADLSGYFVQPAG